jgi:rod shape determining protein RodA
MGGSLMFGQTSVKKTPLQKFRELNWVVVLVLVGVALSGTAMLYSVAGGNMDPWASRHLTRFGVALVMMIVIALIDIRWWMRFAYPIYFIGLVLLLMVEFVGVTGMGGTRWLDLGVMRLQPSELVKVTIILALARYFHGLTLFDTRRIASLFIPVLIIAVPAVLVVRQPDLGTAILLAAGGIGLLFLAGARAWLFVVGIIGAIASIPVAWQFMQNYQRERVLTFLNPERDPLGAGYQILQSKIALGSGGTWGKGFMDGTQSQLNFLPEMKTDFIFTVLAEEFGMMGGIGILLLFMILTGYGVAVSLTCRSQFGRLLASGLSLVLFLYVFINIAMVMGLLPVVGVPLPLVSYGGSAMITVMIAYGLIFSVAIHRRINISRKDSFS